MAIPGFTAEASLPREPLRHRTVLGFRDSSSARRVIGQQFSRFFRGQP
jgi:hypothetical protein